jgi:hypothetical protein
VYLLIIATNSISFISVETQRKFSIIEELGKMQRDCAQHKLEVNEAKDKLNGVGRESIKLQECLEDTMQEIEMLEEDKTITQRHHEEFAQAGIDNYYQRERRRAMREISQYDRMA